MFRIGVRVLLYIYGVELKSSCDLFSILFLFRFIFFAFSIHLHLHPPMLFIHYIAVPIKPTYILGGAPLFIQNIFFFFKSMDTILTFPSFLANIHMNCSYCCPMVICLIFNLSNFSKKKNLFRAKSFQQKSTY